MWCRSSPKTVRKFDFNQTFSICYRVIRRTKTDTGHAGEQTTDQRKLRRCLMCGSMFDSFGPGNRVCKKCKSTKVWRSGV